MEHTEQWLDVEGIAKHLGISAVSIYRWIEKGRIPAHKVGKLWRFKASEVDSWVQHGGAANEKVNREAPEDAQT